MPREADRVAASDDVEHELTGPSAVTIETRMTPDSMPQSPWHGSPWRTGTAPARTTTRGSGSTTPIGRWTIGTTPG